ncbi:MAG: sigma-54 dependent transcriptional regulator [Gemmatimonadota bacterium]|nr:sigma-54 dependent transcriptional regulator [Gemmatimonadota bacterium]
MSELAVLKLSDSFREFWKELALDLDLRLHALSSDGAGVVPSLDSVALLVGAGGAEREAMQWLTDHDLPARVPVFVVGSDPGRRTATQVMSRGATDYFALPEDVELLRNALAAAAEQRRHAPSPSDQSSDEWPDAFAAIAGESPLLRKELTRAARLAPHRNASALILGETGTGKEVMARAIHMSGPRRDGPFVPVNCSALPEQLAESELFGHERGAFTDAHAAKPGLFEVADSGTLFLDEIGDLPPGLQAKLLRVLDDREVRRVGGTKSRTVDVRILAATNENLQRRVQEGTFREDLFFRLSTVVFSLPPLRDREQDVLLIAQALLERLAREHGLPVPAISPDVRGLLMSYSWPGNVRELKNSLERAFLLSPPGELLPDEIVHQEIPLAQPTGPIPFPAPLDEITTAVARATVEWCGGNRSESARRLKISTRRLRRLLGEAGVGVEGVEEEEPVPTPA